MKVRIYRKNSEVAIPIYKTRGAVGFDFEASEAVVVPAGSYAFMKTGIVVEIPKGYMLMLCPRSSTAKKTGLMMYNSVGIIDQDYCGIDDELIVCWYNTGREDFKISKGDRLAQGVFVAVGVAKFDEIQAGDVQSEIRGGFGSTD